MNSPLLITGPCAAETEQQVMQTADELAQVLSDYKDIYTIFRAGIWKPRTSPSTFQGIGEVGLSWLRSVQNKYKWDIAVEVANANQVRSALHAGVNYLWIGARTSANPIAVQEIVDTIVSTPADHCLKGVFVKNPVNDDSALWLGNICRVEKIGIPVMAVHRGCNHHPCWHMAHELICARPDLPLLLDPSHMSGDASLVVDLCVKTFNLGFAGWMIETHCCPQNALSDSKQQLCPGQLSELLNLFPQLIANVDEQNRELDWLRCMIDEEDETIWAAIARRMDISAQIGIWKKRHSIPVIQPTRFNEIMRNRLQWAHEHLIDSKIVEQIMQAIHTESVRKQS